MAVEQPPGVINDITTDAKIQRRVHQMLAGGAVGAFVGGVGATNGAAHGVGATGHLEVTQSGTPAMSVDVAAGLALITGTVSAEQGPYNFYNNATETLVISAADALQPRVDVVVAQIRDSTYSGSDDDARLFVVAGTPAASPVDPTLPDNCLALARVSVAALASSITDANIADLRVVAGSLSTVSDAIAVLQAPIHYRQSRAAASYVAGDTTLQGAVTVVENSGGFTGDGSSGSPLIVPVTGVYSITIRFTVAAGLPASCRPIISAGLSSVAWEMPSGTALSHSYTIAKHCTAASGVTAAMRNQSGGTVASVITALEVTLINPPPIP